MVEQSLILDGLLSLPITCRCCWCWSRQIWPLSHSLTFHLQNCWFIVFVEDLLKLEEDSLVNVARIILKWSWTNRLLFSGISIHRTLMLILISTAWTELTAGIVIVLFWFCWILILYRILPRFSLWTLTVQLLSQMLAILCVIHRNGRVACLPSSCCRFVRLVWRLVHCCASLVALRHSCMTRTHSVLIVLLRFVFIAVWCYSGLSF